MPGWRDAIVNYINCCNYFLFLLSSAGVDKIDRRPNIVDVGTKYPYQFQKVGNSYTKAEMLKNLSAGGLKAGEHRC